MPSTWTEVVLAFPPCPPCPPWFKVQARWTALRCSEGRTGRNFTGRSGCASIPCAFRYGASHIGEGLELASTVGEEKMDNAAPGGDPRGQPLLRVSGLCVQFGGIVALEDMSFDVMQGRI